MNPLIKCCGYYCSCLCVVGIIVFALLAIMEANMNPVLARIAPEESTDRRNALIIACVVNAVCATMILVSIHVLGKKEAGKTEAGKKKDREI